MISVEEALARVVAAFAPLESEQVPLHEALGRVLAEDVAARTTQPPVAVSAMAGFAVRFGDLDRVPAVLEVVGEAPAGRSFEGRLAEGQAVRIFTGGPVPDGADSIVVTTRDGRDFPARVLGYDEASGLALLQTQVPLGVEPLALADSKGLAVQSPVLMLTGKGLQEAGTAQVVSRRTFAGYWEYVLDEAIFTYPAHPNWGGTGLISGRKAFQKPTAGGVQLRHAIQGVYLCREVTAG